MKIQFVNHSSFIVEHEGVRIISDPWLEGRVFNNGWDLISKSKFMYDDFKEIQYIWFSHEHPDHFFPPNLKLIPAENVDLLINEIINRYTFYELYNDKANKATGKIKLHFSNDTCAQMLENILFKYAK